MTKFDRATIAVLAIIVPFVATPALANHTVLVEGQTDFDGDGLLGADEDVDGDQIFGTLNGGLQGVGFNGRVTIVTSGEFNEQVRIDPAGVTVLEAAPGVFAEVEAFEAPDDAVNGPANAARQSAPGVIVEGDGTFPVEIRNIISRNWSIGFLIQGRARVTLDGVLADSNTDSGIRVRASAAALINDSQATANGVRNSGSPGFDVPEDIRPVPGDGIRFTGNSSGFVVDTQVANNAGPGLAVSSNADVEVLDLVEFNNGS